MRGPALGRRRRSWPFGILVAACVVMLVVLLGLGDYLALDHRLGRIDITPTSGAGETWVIAGSDSRADLPAGTNVYGTTADAPGQRADVVLVVHKQAGKTSILSLPRDLLVWPKTSTPARLTLTLQQPQMLVDSLCNLGIPTNHLAMVGMAGFAKVIDALGGVTVTVPYPVTDAYTGLEITTAGTQKLTGVQALALVRSRHPRQLINGAWVQAADAAGTEDRTEWAGRVFHATLTQAKRAALNPIRAQALAWAAAGALRTDPGTSLADLARIWPANATIMTVPADEAPGTYIAEVTTATRDALSAAGFAPGNCRPHQ